MEEETQIPNNTEIKKHNTTTTTTTTTDLSCKILKKWLLILNCACLALGTTAGPLIMRLYFLHGGNRKWLSSWLETGGFPILLIPLCISYMLRNRQARAKGSTTKLLLITPRLLMASAFIGLLTGIDDYIYALGLSYLPVSTSAILLSTHLAFTAIFAFLLVKQKFTPYSINAVVLLTLGAVILGLHTSGDRPANVSKGQYLLGFFLTLAAALLYGFVLPLVELTYAKARVTITYTLIMEMQFVISLAATAFCTVGMYVNNDFKVMPREAREFGYGEVLYYVILVMSGIAWQMFFIGAMGVILCASSLVSGIVIAFMIPVSEVLAVIFYHEKFNGQKGLSLVLSLWGFASYFYGEHRINSKKKTRPEIEISSAHCNV